MFETTRGAPFTMRRFVPVKRYAQINDSHNRRSLTPIRLPTQQKIDRIKNTFERSNKSQRRKISMVFLFVLLCFLYFGFIHLVFYSSVFTLYFVLVMHSGLLMTLCVQIGLRFKIVSTFFFTQSITATMHIDQKIALKLFIN